MTPKSQEKILVVAEHLASQIYGAILKASGYEVRLHIHAESEQGTWVKEALEAVSSFHPHVVILQYGSIATDEFVEKLLQACDPDGIPATLAIAPSDTWCEKANKCLPGPVHPDDLRQAVEDLLHRRRSVDTVEG